jgi:hypothetical protein
MLNLALVVVSSGRHGSGAAGHAYRVAFGAPILGPDLRQIRQPVVPATDENYPSQAGSGRLAPLCAPPHHLSVAHQLHIRPRASTFAAPCVGDLVTRGAGLSRVLRKSASRGVLWSEKTSPGPKKNNRVARSRLGISGFGGVEVRRN